VPSASCFGALFLFFFFYFIPGIITSCYFAQRLVIHLAIYESLEEHMPNGVLSINYSIRDTSLEIVLFLIGVISA